MEKVLTEEQYMVLRQKGTEAPFSGKLLHSDAKGAYVCAACGNPLFLLTRNLIRGRVGLVLIPPSQGRQKSFRTIRTECLAWRRFARVAVRIWDTYFQVGRPETGKRYCMNSVCLELKENS